MLTSSRKESKKAFPLELSPCAGNENELGMNDPSHGMGRANKACYWLEKEEPVRSVEPTQAHQQL